MRIKTLDIARKEALAPRALDTLNFTLPQALEATEPPEARGLARDEVRLMISNRATPCVTHTQFREIGAFLRAGDTLVINTSGTLNAALGVTRADGTPLELHLSTRLPGGFWSVEARTSRSDGARPYREDLTGETLYLPGGATATLHAPYPAGATPPRLWLATMRTPQPVPEYLERFGFPIRYGYIPDLWPSRFYQTAYVTEMGSAEAPSAGLAFTPELIAALAARGIVFAPLLLHTGVSSLEDHEPPYEEYFRVPESTARLVNAARAAGGRVIAVGTTAVRALETVAETDGAVHAGSGWTDLVIEAARGVRVVDGLLTGLHEPRSSHLAMLEAFTRRDWLRAAYDAALREGYLWHEFGDLHLLLP
ncbi:MAG TPA: S-adenosylmethionine:tRNA ribosyltransferase-isomerase [Ktedonobacterales bacterium]